jgi:hypothetical protein
MGVCIDGCVFTIDTDALYPASTGPLRHGQQYFEAANHILSAREKLERL